MKTLLYIVTGIMTGIILVVSGIVIALNCFVTSINRYIGN
jgi:hypothetical protein